VCGDHVCSGTETTTSCAADCAFGSLQVQNASSFTIYYLYVWSCGTVGPGCWNLKAMSNGTQYWQTPAGITIDAGSTYTWTLTN
jgi:hypothetical protein